LGCWLNKRTSLEQVHELRIEVDEAKRTREVAEITEAEP
jgi:CHAD domain-containing protein